MVHAALTAICIQIGPRPVPCRVGTRLVDIPCTHTMLHARTMHVQGTGLASAVLHRQEAMLRRMVEFLPVHRVATIAAHAVPAGWTSRCARKRLLIGQTSRAGLL